MVSISIEELQKLISSRRDFFLIDVRRKPELVNGMLPTALHLPADEIGTALNLDDLAFYDRYGFRKFTKKDRIILYCRSGTRSAIVTKLLRDNGYDAYNYQGSILEWSRFDQDVKSY